MKAHIDNEFLRRRKAVDIPGSLRAVSLSEYDGAVIVPMWGYKDVEVSFGFFSVFFFFFYYVFQTSTV